MVPASPHRGLSIRRYAAHRRSAGLPGGSRRAVEVALASGRISRNDHGKIDPAAADAEWNRNTKGTCQAPRPQRPDGEPLERIAVALERIAVALEAAGPLGHHFEKSAFQVGLR